LFLANLLSLPCLLVKKTKGRKSLVDYRQSHIIISKEYANILQNKTMDKEIITKIKEKERKRKTIKELNILLTPLP